MVGKHFREVPEGELVGCSQVVNHSMMTMDSGKEIAEQMGVWV